MGTTARRSSRPYVSERRTGAPVRPRNVRYPAPAPDRLRPHRKRRQPSIPLGVKVLLAVALLAMGAVTTVAASGVVGGALSSLGGSVGAIFSAQLGGPSPSPTPLSAPGAPRLVPTGTGWTNQSDLTVHGFVPQGLGDQHGYSVRIYINGELAGEEALTGTQDFAVTVAIPDGPSVITATILGPAGEGSESAPLQIVFDDTPPALKISAPKKGATIKADSVTVKGTTQPDSTVTVRNDSNGGRASAVATNTGAFAIEISITGGPNALEVTAVDPAGNSKTATLSVIGGNGSASASLSLTKTSFRVADLPSAIGASVRVLGPTGKAISGATVVFTIQIPGVGPIQSPEILTVNGIASFNTQVPKGATVGAGLVTVIVTTDSYGTLSDTAAFRIS
jgi:Glucodextranase, domain B